jgi:hypothetical protein
VSVKAFSAGAAGKNVGLKHARFPLQTVFKYKKQSTEKSSCALLCVQSGLLQNFCKFGKQHVIAGLVGYVVDVDVADHAVFIHNENSPFGKALITQNAVLPGNGAQGVEIAQQRE